MKRQDIENCVMCGRGLMACGNPMFHKISVQAFAIDARAIQNQHGLEQFFGGGSAGAALADVIGSDPDIAKPITITETVHLVCGECAISEGNLARLFFSEKGE